MILSLTDIAAHATPTLAYKNTAQSNAVCVIITCKHVPVQHVHDRVNMLSHRAWCNCCKLSLMQTFFPADTSANPKDIETLKTCTDCGQATDLLVGAVLQYDQAVDGGQGMQGLVGPLLQLPLPLLCRLQPQVVQMLPLSFVCRLHTTATTNHPHERVRTEH